MQAVHANLILNVTSGIGYGLLFWLGLLVAAGQAARNPLLVASAVLVAAGLLLAGWLLNPPLPRRGERARASWRWSWRSSAGAAMALSVAPIAAMPVLVWTGAPRAWQAGAALAVCVLAAASVYATARQYRRLAAVRVWDTGWTSVAWLALAAASGGTWLWAIGVLGFALPAHRGDSGIFLSLLAIATALVVGRWRHADRRPVAGAHLFAGADFVAMREHPRRWRWLCVTLLLLVPGTALAAAAVDPYWRPVAAAIALPAVTLALLLERWLFFAPARADASSAGPNHD